MLDHRRFSTGRYLSPKGAREFWSSAMLSRMSTRRERDSTGGGLTIQAATHEPADSFSYQDSRDDNPRRKFDDGSVRLQLHPAQ